MPVGVGRKRVKQSNVDPTRPQRLFREDAENPSYISAGPRVACRMATSQPT